MGDTINLEAGNLQTAVNTLEAHVTSLYGPQNEFTAELAVVQDAVKRLLTAIAESPEKALSETETPSQDLPSTDPEAPETSSPEVA